MGYLWDNIEQV